MTNSKTFYYNGPKNDNKSLDFGSGCALFIGFAAIIYLIALLDSVEDIKEYGWQIALALLMGGSLLFGIFRQKGKKSNKKVVIKNNYLLMEDVSIHLANCTLDTYNKGNRFERYHLWDNKGKMAIYSVFEDDLSRFFTKEYPAQTCTREVTEISTSGPSVKVTAGTHVFGYDLLTGHFYFIEDRKGINRFTPEIFAYDGKYALRKRSGRLKNS